MKPRIPINDLSREYVKHRQITLGKIDAFFSSGEYILGPTVTAFEKAFARYTGTKYCIGVGNGLEAIQIALMGLGIGKGDEVITVSNTDIATALAIVHVGATPIFVDVDEYFHMDACRIEQAITKQTKAILPVHLFGQMADMDAIMRIAKKHKLFVIEDACQAHGATYRRKKAGSFGDAGCFSFYPTKNLGAMGDAGAIVTQSSAFADKCRMLRNRGSKKRGIHTILGLNSRLDGLQAVILSEKLKRLDAMNRKRKRIAERYASLLRGIPEVELPRQRELADHVFHQHVIRVSRRDELQKYLADHGVQTLVHYPIPIHRQRPFHTFSSISLPITEHDATHILSIPIHPLLTDSDIEYVVDGIRRFYRRARI